MWEEFKARASATFALACNWWTVFAIFAGWTVIDPSVDAIKAGTGMTDWINSVLTNAQHIVENPILRLLMVPLMIWLFARGARSVAAEKARQGEDARALQLRLADAAKQDSAHFYKAMRAFAEYHMHRAEVARFRELIARVDQHVESYKTNSADYLSETPFETHDAGMRGAPQIYTRWTANWAPSEFKFLTLPPFRATPDPPGIEWVNIEGGPIPKSRFLPERNQKFIGYVRDEIGRLEGFGQDCRMKLAEEERSLDVRGAGLKEYVDD